MTKRVVLNFIVVVGLILLVDQCEAQSSGWFWQNPLPQGNQLNSVSFSADGHCVAVGDFGAIICSSDRGETWSAQASGTSNNLRGVCLVDANTGVAFVDSSIGIAVGDHGTMLQSSDGRKTWSWRRLERCYFERIFLLDENTWTLVGYPGILHTTDAGTSWRYRTIEGKEPLTGVWFTDAMTGTVVGKLGIILRTTDGGTTWEPQLPPGGTSDAYSFFDVVFTDNTTGFIVGAYGTILRTTTGGVTWVEDERPAPSLFHLGQNYPNPVTTSTTIPFSLTKPEHVTLSVYNMLGRQVAGLVDETREMGSHPIPFDATGLASGMYFYVLRTGNAIETRKMLVVNPAVGL